MFVAARHQQRLSELNGFSQAPAPRDWWRLFGDSRLSDLVAQAIDANLDLKSASERIAASEALLGLTDAANQPQLGAGADYTRAAISGHSPLHDLGAPTTPFNTWRIGLQASWEIDLWGRLAQLQQGSLERRDAGVADYEGARISIAAETARTYLLLRGVQAQLQLNADAAELARAEIPLAESRIRNGVVGRAALDVARAGLDKVAAERAALSERRDRLANALAALLSRGPHDLDAFLGVAPPPRLPTTLPAGVPSQLLQRRPDIAAAEARLRAAAAEVGAAEADFFPRINLKGGFAKEAYTVSELGSWASRAYSFGPTVYLPIFDGGRLKSTLALSQAQQREAAIGYQQTVLRAWREADDALDAVAAARQKLKQEESAKRHYDDALAAVRRGFDQGAADQSSVLAARRAVLAVSGARLEALVAAQLAVVELFRALGGGWSANEARS
ncbi:NodT family efflux transporter outer membrane factor (OMF) lipoprotein [Rhodoblastus acidophilus]|nr:NodT family efflux transporter outer membrane factor (OMF) lipoprotein [Rhodoblastus acidophilus]